MIQTRGILRSTSYSRTFRTVSVAGCWTRWGSPFMAGRRAGALLIVGPGGGGKSTLLAALAACLGNTGGGYAGDMSEGALASGKQVHAGLNPEMAVFQLPKRLVVVGEESALSNIGRFKRLTGGDNLTVRKPYERESRTLRVSATIVQAVNEDTLPNLRLENEATFDRLRTLPYPSIPESERDPNLGGVLVNHPGARQALFALLIRHAVENRLAPADIPSVAEKRAEVRRESIGAGFYDWATSAVVKTGIGYEMLFTSEAWDSALAYAAQDNDVGENADVVWGMKRYQFIRKLRSFLELPPARQLRRDDFAGRGWQRVRLARPSEIETSTAEASQPELYCTSKLEDGATCGQPIENGRCIAEFDHRDNSDQGPPPAAATGGKQGELPGTAERGGQRNHLVHALDRRIEYWKSVQREAVAKPDSSALWQCTFVRPVTQVAPRGGVLPRDSDSKALGRSWGRRCVSLQGSRRSALSCSLILPRRWTGTRCSGTFGAWWTRRERTCRNKPKLECWTG